MKALFVTSLLFALTACSNVDHHVKLIGEFNDHKAETRYEVYVRAVKIDNPERLKHREEPLFLDEKETRQIISHLKNEEDLQSLIHKEVLKDLDNGKGLHLPQKNSDDSK